MKKFCLSTDFRRQTIEFFSHMHETTPNRVIEVYGNITQSGFSSGRSELNLPQCSLEELAIYIDFLHKNGIEFSYTFNSPCLSNNEFTERGYKRIISFLGQLIDVGVDRFTIASPVLIELITAVFPQIKVTASAICQIDSLEKARDYASLKSVDRLVIFEDGLRDFKLIESISTTLPVELEAIINQHCLFGCSYRIFHRTAVAHDWPLRDDQIEADTYYQSCMIKKLTKVANFLKMPGIIRPEDLTYYEKAGVNYFKIIDRTQRITDFNVVNKYLKETLEGNFFDLLPNLATYLYLDNRKLDGFMEFFVQHQNPCSRGCSDCGYCDHYARDIVKNEATITQRLRKLKKEVTGFVQKGPHVYVKNIRKHISSC